MIYYHSCPNLYIFPLLNTKEDILKNVGTQMVLVPLTSIVFFCSIKWKSMGTKTVCLPNVFKISSSMSCRSKKCTQVLNDMKVSKLWVNFHFCVDCRFKSLMKLGCIFRLKRDIFPIFTPGLCFLSQPITLALLKGRSQIWWIKAFRSTHTALWWQPTTATSWHVVSGTRVSVFTPLRQVLVSFVMLCHLYTNLYK